MSHLTLLYRTASHQIESLSAPRWQQQWNEHFAHYNAAKTPLDRALSLAQLRATYSNFIETAAFVGKTIVAHHYASIANPKIEPPVDLQKGKSEDSYIAMGIYFKVAWNRLLSVEENNSDEWAMKAEVMELKAQNRILTLIAQVSSPSA